MSFSYRFSLADYCGGPCFHFQRQLLQSDAFKTSANQPDHSVFEVSYGIGRISSWRLSGQPLFEMHDDSLSCSLKVGLEFSNLKIGPNRFFSGHFL